MVNLLSVIPRYPSLPTRIDEEKATKAREDMVRKKVIYGHSVPYRNMCRFNSGVSSRGHAPYLKC